MRARWSLPALGIIAMVAATPARAQISYGSPASLDAGFVLTGWTLEDTAQKVTVDQVVAPFGGFVPLRENLEARYLLAYASSKATVDGDAHQLAGLGDVRLQLNQTLARDRVILGLGVNLPTGKRNLDYGDDWLVMHYLSQDILAFPLRRLGEGLGLSATLGGAVDWGSLLVGATVAYEYAGSYNSYVGVDDYDPGDQINATLRAETTGTGLHAFAGFTYADFTADRVGGRDVFSQNWYTRSSLGVDHRGARIGMGTRISYLLRDRATTYDHAGAVLQNLRLYGNELVWSARAAFHGATKARPWRVGPLVELRWIDSNEYGNPASRVQAYGLDSEVTVMDRLRASLGVRYFTGGANDHSLDIHGYQVAFSLTGVY